MQSYKKLYIYSTFLPKFFVCVYIPFAMPDIFCACSYEALVNIPVIESLWMMVLEFIFSIMIVVGGEVINYRFLSKLRE